MPAASTGSQTARATLEALAAALDAGEFATTLVAGEGRVPHLTVASRYAKLSEEVYAEGGWLWWSWAERLAPATDLPAAAAKIAKVLRAVPGARGPGRAGGPLPSPGYERAL